MAQAAAKVAVKEKIVSDIPETIYDKNSKKIYKRGKLLGKGCFGRCYELTDMNTRAIFAGKIVHKSLLRKQNEREKMAQEVSIHRDLRHEYIVGFHSYFEDDLNVYIILELCTKKSLQELQNRRGHVTEPEARYFLRQIMMGVNYLHNEKKIIHRDLKLDNIFVNDQMNIKLGDFGFATTVEFDGQQKTTFCGTPNYMAPEIVAKKGHSFPADVWSIGCILYTLLIGQPPFEVTTLRDTYSKIKRGDYIIPPTNKISAPAKHLIKTMLQVDPSLRPKSKDILRSEFLTKSYIPTQLSQSCLTMRPRLDNRANNEPLHLQVEPTPATPSSFTTSSLQHNPPLLSFLGCNSVTLPINTEDVMIYNQPPTNMLNLHRQMKTLLDQDLVKKKIDNDDESEDPNSAPLLWITKWVDYSDKHGFGYQLSDDSIGVSFNDLTTMVLLPDGLNMHYIDVNGCEHYHTKEKYPSDLQKKVTLLNYIQQYMTENLLKAGGNIQIPETINMVRLPVLSNWFRTSRAVVMVLTNGSLQINDFRNHTKMILCPLMGAITTLGRAESMRTFKFSSISEHGCTLELYSKLKYAFEKLGDLIGTEYSETEGLVVNQDHVNRESNNCGNVQGQQRQDNNLENSKLVGEFPDDGEDDDFLAHMDI